MKSLFLVGLTFIILSGLQAQKKQLCFNADGKFKIVQITDTHYNHENPKCDLAIQMIEQVLDVEKPDLVVFTGDIAMSSDMSLAWEKVTAPVVRHQIPWTFVLGNHDAERWATKEKIFDIIDEIPYCIAERGKEKVSGMGNYVLPVWNKNNSKVAALIYCLDSQEYAQKKGVGKYGWFAFDQIRWYQKMSDKWIKSNDDVPLPALAYLHIPLPEYKAAWENETIKPVGVRDEKICSPELNTGMYAAMLLQGDVMGVFAGHDHVNDFVGDYNGIALGYGRFSGGTNTYGNHTNGVRVVVLKQNQRKFDTWIREKDGVVKYKTCCPLSKL
ncbi:MULTISPECIES: metallophosphoesterase family protein [unclassified Carboxylicivirga]|uniref:metallophosphoesterase family protein n=1 Tax=Carboxylicivirga TaxID=1628153 RepID=UPI003D341DC7